MIRLNSNGLAFECNKFKPINIPTIQRVLSLSRELVQLFLTHPLACGKLETGWIVR